MKSYYNYNYINDILRVHFSELSECPGICSISLAGSLITRQGRYNAILTRASFGTHCLGNGVSDAWLATSAVVELGRLTGLGLGDFGSIPGMTGSGLILLEGS